MKTVTLRKIYQNKVSLRDYVVEQAIREGEAIRVIYGDEEVILTPHVLSTQGLLDKVVYKSKFDKREYRLIDYDWVTEQEEVLVGQGRLIV